MSNDLELNDDSINELSKQETFQNQVVKTNNKQIEKQFFFDSTLKEN